MDDVQDASASHSALVRLVRLSHEGNQVSSLQGSGSQDLREWRFFPSGPVAPNLFRSQEPPADSVAILASELCRSNRPGRLRIAD